MKITFLGTGTSVGVPMIGCDCPVCTSSDPRNKRRRASIFIEFGGFNIVVDTPPDFREQALEYRIERVDAVIFTHSHADHVFGFDDIRRFNTIQGNVIPAYGLPGTIADMRRIFDYPENLS
jgi:phosphoribosyl 1,2-cyclic phosphate phosphodiesterase